MRITAQQFQDVAVQAMEPWRGGKKHIGAITFNQTDALKAAKVGGAFADCTLAATTMHPDPVNASFRTIAHHAFGVSRRSHDECALNRWIYLLYVAETAPAL